MIGSILHRIISAWRGRYRAVLVAETSPATSPPSRPFHCVYCLSSPPACPATHTPTPASAPHSVGVYVLAPSTTSSTRFHSRSRCTATWHVSHSPQPPPLHASMPGVQTPPAAAISAPPQTPEPPLCAPDYLLLASVVAQPLPHSSTPCETPPPASASDISSTPFAPPTNSLSIRCSTTTNKVHSHPQALRTPVLFLGIGRGVPTAIGRSVP